MGPRTEGIALLQATSRAIEMVEDTCVTVSNKRRAKPAPPVAPVVDDVTELVASWARERPDIDIWPLRPLAAAAMFVRLFTHYIAATFADLGLKGGDYDLLSRLRRANPEHRVSPTDLAEMLDLTTGAITRRLDRLEQMGYVERTPHGQDRRSLIIVLTPSGLEMADRAVERLVQASSEFVGPLRDQVDVFEALIRLVTESPVAKRISDND